MSQKIEKIVTNLVTNKEVYALGLEGGYAKSLSTIFVDEDDLQIEIFCFWVSKDLASECVVSDWEEYKVVAITLSTFMEDWCIGMSNENYAVGLDFDKNMEGIEIDPLELLLSICNRLMEQKIEPVFSKFKSVAEIKKYTEEALEYEA